MYLKILERICQCLQSVGNGRSGSTVLVEGRNVNGFLLVAREAVNYSV